MKTRSIISTMLCVGVWFAAGLAQAADASKVVLVLKTLDNPFFTEIERGFRDTFNSQGVEVVVRAGSNESDLSAQRRILEALYNQNVEGGAASRIIGVAITPVGSSSELVAPIKLFRDKRVPVIVVDTKIDKAVLAKANTDYSAFVGSSNRDGGEIAAHYIFEKLRAKGPLSKQTIYLLNGAIASETANERRLGFVSVYNSLDQVERPTLIERTADWRRTDAENVVRGFLSVSRTIDAIFAANDEMALGAANAFRSFGRSYPIIVGFDATSEALDAVKAGKLTATVAQDPYAMGKFAAQALMLPDSGKSFDDTTIPVKLCTPACK